MTSEPGICGNGLPHSIHEASDAVWKPMIWHDCSFPPEVFSLVMENLIKNPNINSTYLFRADISFDCSPDEAILKTAPIPPRVQQFQDFELKRVIVRTMIPRNILVDKPLDQSCLIYQQIVTSEVLKSLVVYFPHISSASESPFYHPGVRGIAFLHTYDSTTSENVVSIHYSLFGTDCITPKLERTAARLLAVTCKHGQGQLAGYVKKVHHDVVLPQAIVQNTYARLKSKYASSLISSWVETTDPRKHVFEDLAIAAFLIELWADMYGMHGSFPGFVDIGCGNGLLVHILLSEGYEGWGFDARKRRSWKMYGTQTNDKLKEMVLMPNLHPEGSGQSSPRLPDHAQCIHEGRFEPGLFIISNHADELTPWTPLLAIASKSPFIIIPCCSHNLTGAKFRAPPSKEEDASPSTYASLVCWVAKIARDCGWNVEKEMLRIPSTRNTALIGRHRHSAFEDIQLPKIVRAYGGAEGWEANAMKLVKSQARNH